MSNDNKSTAFLLGGIIRHIKVKARKRFAEEGIQITAEQFGLLNMITVSDEFIQAELATLLDKDKSAVLRHIDILERNNLIVRVNDVNDRRKKILMLTKTGEATLAKCNAIICALTDEVEKGVPENELEVFRSVLLKMKANAEKTH